MEALPGRRFAAEMKPTIKVVERLHLCFLVTFNVGDQPSKLIREKPIHRGAALGRKNARLSDEVSVKSDRDILLHGCSKHVDYV
jgi:hypothetical protein